MTTFQAVVTAVISVFSEIFPVAPAAHEFFLDHFFGWSPPSELLRSALYLGLGSSLVLYFRHDFLSHFSSFLQIVVYHRKPMAIDERMPFFVALSATVSITAWFFLRNQVPTLEEQPVIYASIFMASGLLPWFLDGYTRKNKNHYDWNWVDALLLGIFQSTAILPWVGRTTGALTITFFRNFSREGASKFILYSATPLMIAMCLTHWKANGFQTAGEGVSQLTFFVTTVTSCLAGFFFIHSFLRQIPKVGVKRYAIYRIVLGAAFLAHYFWSNR